MLRPPLHLLLLGLALLTLPATAQTLLLHYDFETGTGTTIQDVSGNGYTATLGGGSFSTDAALGSFAASLGRVNLPNNTSSPGFALPGDAFSLALWLKLPLVNASLPLGIQAVFANTTAAGYGRPGLQFYINSYQTANGAVLLDLSDGSNSVEKSTAAGTFPADGAWHQLTLTVDRSAGSASVYLDGTVRAAWSNLPTSFPVSSPADVLGQFADGNYQCHGLMDDVRIYQGVLTPGQVLALVPEPSVLALILLAGLILGLRGTARTLKALS